MSIITALSSPRTFSSPLLLKTFAMAMACAVVSVCCAASDVAPAVSAIQLPIGTLAAVPSAYMTFAAGVDAEPPPWLENTSSSKNPPSVPASAAPAAEG